LSSHSNPDGATADPYNLWRFLDAQRGACEQAERSSVEYVNCHQAFVDFIQHILQSCSKQRYFGKYLQYLLSNSLKISSAIPITVLRERHKGGNDD